MGWNQLHDTELEARVLGLMKQGIYGEVKISNTLGVRRSRFWSSVYRISRRLAEGAGLPPAVTTQQRVTAVTDPSRDARSAVVTMGSDGSVDGSVAVASRQQLPQLFQQPQQPQQPSQQLQQRLDPLAGATLSTVGTTTLELTPLERKVTLNPILFVYYDFMRAKGFPGDFGEFIFRIVKSWFKHKHMKLEIINTSELADEE